MCSIGIDYSKIPTVVGWNRGCVGPSCGVDYCKIPTIVGWTFRLRQLDFGVIIVKFLLL